MEIPISNTPSTTVPKSSEYRQRMKLTVLYKFARLMARIHSVIEGALPHHLITSLILYSPHDMSRYGPTDIDPCTPFRFRGRARNRPSFSMPQTMSAEHYLILFFRALHGSGVPYLDGRGWWGAVEGHGATFLRVRLYRGVRYTPSPQVQSSLTLSDCSIVYNLATTPGVEANLFIQIRHSKRTTRRFFWIHPLTCCVGGIMLNLKTRPFDLTASISAPEETAVESEPKLAWTIPQNFTFDEFP